MLIKNKAFILAVIKYSDNDAIIKTYTKKNGFITFFIKSLYKSNKSKLKNAYFQPGAILELISTNRNNGKMEYIREARPLFHYKNIHFEFDKLTVSVFLREILLEILSKEPSNEELYNFITNKFMYLDKEKFSPDFHIYFLVELMKYMGISPDINTNGDYFDMINGIFTDNIHQISHYLNKKQALFLKNMLGMIFAAKNKVKFTNFERQQMLNLLLKYYEMQIEGFKYPTSLRVLNEIYK